MTLERFITLLVAYFISVLLSLVISRKMKWTTFSQQLISMTVIGFIALSILLVCLTLMK